MLDLLRSLIEEVTAADARRYGVTDDTGREMHCAKIIEAVPAPAEVPVPAESATAAPVPAGPAAAPTASAPTLGSPAAAGHAAERYLAVYHSTLPDGYFHVGLATSSDLVEWHHVRDFGRGTSQPTIAAVPGGGYLLAWEQEPKNHIALRYFPGREALLRGHALREFDAKRSLSRCAEGTPNIYSVRLDPDIDHSVVRLGGHYWWKCDRDRQLSATLTGFKRWRAVREPGVDEALLRFDVGGNIGGRDAITFFGHDYAVIEAQHAKGDFGTWRTYVYDYATNEAHPAKIRTDGGSTAFANPHVTALTAPDGRRALAMSLFLPGEGAAKGEGGQLIYHRTY